MNNMITNSMDENSKAMINAAYEACVNNTATAGQKLIWQLAHAIHLARISWVTDDVDMARQILFENDYTVGICDPNMITLIDNNKEAKINSDEQYREIISYAVGNERADMMAVIEADGYVRVYNMDRNYYYDSNNDYKKKIPEDILGRLISMSTKQVKNDYENSKKEKKDNVIITSYEQCPYFLQKDTTPWHGDVFDHPEYKFFCTKAGDEREIIFPEGQCKRCLKRSQNI